MSTTTDQNPCAIQGQQDIYGLGIRISLYLQWYSGILAYVYMREEASLPITTNYLIAIAVGIACMVHQDDIYSLEVMIVALLMMVPPLALLMVLGEFLLFSWQTYKIEPPIETLPVAKYSIMERVIHIGVLVATAFLLSVMVWGFFYGPDVMKKAVGCQPKFAGSYYLTGTYSTGLRIWSVALIVFAISTILFFMFFRLLAGTSKRGAISFWLIEGVAKFTRTSHEQSPLNNDFPFRYIRPIAVILCGAVVSTCVMTIELVIYQNEIQGVNDIVAAGQLIPLTIGVASFFLMIFQRFQAVSKGNHKSDSQSTGESEGNNPQPVCASCPFAAPTMLTKHENQNIGPSPTAESQGPPKIPTVSAQGIEETRS